MRLLVISLFGFVLTGVVTAAELPSGPPASTLPGPPPAPPLPAPQSLVKTFRELLEMTPEARARALASKSEQHRKVINERLQEFDKLSPEQRQVRLRLMQLRIELLPLLRSAPTNRTALFSVIPDEDKKLINERLKYWNQLPEDLQKWVLENELMLGYFLSGQASNPVELGQNLEAFPAHLRPTITNSIAAFRRLTSDQQQKLCRDFIEVFGLDDAERQKIMERTLSQSGDERKQIERLVVSFQKLPKAQQQQCMESLRRFTSMSTPQRVQFLQNAQRWEKMPEPDREAWRNLIKKVPPLPPVPPGANFPGSGTKLSSNTNQTEP
jgi:hypothetical protein